MLQAPHAELRDNPSREGGEGTTVAARFLRAIRPNGSSSTLLRRLGWALLALAIVFPWLGGSFFTRLAI